MISKNNTPSLKNNNATSKNTTSNVISSGAEGNASTSKNSSGSARNYVSGDSVPSSSSHQFHKKSPDER
jgi:hypothetical protein